jgi:hypothetical protein
MLAKAPPEPDKTTQFEGGVALNIAIMPFAPPGIEVIFWVAMARTTFL